MSHHDEIRAALADYAVGRRAHEEHERLEQHVESCSECSDWLDTYAFMLEGLVPDHSEHEHPASHLLALWACAPDQLSGAVIGELERHVETCTSCAAEFDLAVAAVEPVEPMVPAGPAAHHHFGGRFAIAAVVVLAIGFGVTRHLSLRPQFAGDALPGLVVSENLSGRQTITSEDAISAQRMRIESGADITFRAGSTVVLGDGFSVDTGSSFTVVLEPE